MKKIKILILGAGFGGINAYLNLHKELNETKTEISIINKTNYFLFSPLLHEIATGNLSQYNGAEPIRQIISPKNCNFYQKEVKEINLQKQIVKTEDTELSYDYLIIALGSETNFYNIKGAEKYSFVLKDLHDAIKIRKHIIEVFEKALCIKNKTEREKLLSFVIVGAGATGVELATEISDLFTETFEKYYYKYINPNEIKLYLINKGGEILMQFDLILRQKALEKLKKKNIIIKLNSDVSEITEEGVKLNNNDFIYSKNIIWTSGVKANLPKIDQTVELDKIGRILVDEYLRVKNYINVFAIGDNASFTDENSKQLPMLAQVATQEAKTLAKNIKNSINLDPLETFHYKSKGQLISLGKFQAIADISNFKFQGPIAWFIWRTVYLFNFTSMRKRIKIAIDWTINLFTLRDISQE